MRVLRIFHGISGREVVLVSLHTEYSCLVASSVTELEHLAETFHLNTACSLARHLPPASGMVMWLSGLRQRMLEAVEQVAAVSSSLLENDNGKRLRQLQAELLEKIAQCETHTVDKWVRNIPCQLLKDKLNEPLWKKSFSSGSSNQFCQLEVNLDSHLLVVLREVEYFSDLLLSEDLESLVTGINASQLQATAVKLEEIAYKYNEIITGITETEGQLFESKLFKIKMVSVS